MNSIATARRSPLLTALIIGLVVAAGMFARPHIALAATGACTAPSTDYGSVSGAGLSGIVTSGPTTDLWVRMAIPDTTNKTVMIEVDNSSGTALDCYTVTATAAAVYTSADATASTYFNNDTSNWVDTTIPASGTGSLPAGTYNLKLIGSAPNVVVDRVLLAQSGSCTAPTGVGTNCTTVADTTAPVASITSPVANAAVTGTQTVAVSASDNVAVTGVDIYDGATKLGSATLSSGTSASGTWSYSWNTSSSTVGSSHVLMAHVTDGSNPIVSPSVTVTIKDVTPPTVSITAPSAGSTQSGVFTATATAADNVAVTKVEFYVDGNLKTTDASGPYTASIDTTALSNASHSLTAKAYDLAGNGPTTSTAVAFTVNNTTGGTDTTPPTVSIATPTNNAILSNDLNNSHFKSSTYVVTVNASDTSGIKNVVFKVDGTTVATVTAAPYTYTMDLTKLSAAAHTLTATATDSSTNANAATATASFKSTYSSDINGDFHVTILDLSAFASKYGQTGGSSVRADIDQDGSVGILDLSALASQFNKH